MDSVGTLPSTLEDMLRLMDSLTYASYCHQRRISPHIEAWRWHRVFRDADALEQRYQAERKGEHLLHDDCGLSI